ncbi:restriction endonuclease, partial [Thomasclavelia ramosa]
MYNSLQEEENRYLLFYYLIDKKVLFMLTEYAFMFPMSLFELGMDAIKLDIETCKVNDNFISDLFENEENKKTYYTLFDIDNMRGIEFENFLSRLFINMGYVSVVTKATQDQGADLLLEKDEEKIVVQAKNYSSNVGNDAIQEVYSALKYYNCKRALVVTNSFFTKQAIDLAIKLDVVLWDRDKLIDLIKEYPVERV